MFIGGGGGSSSCSISCYEIFLDLIEKIKLNTSVKHISSSLISINAKKPYCCQ
jgi:hypothetical protein